MQHKIVKSYRAGDFSLDIIQQRLDTYIIENHCISPCWKWFVEYSFDHPRSWFKTKTAAEKFADKILADWTKYLKKQLKSVELM